MKLPLLLVIFAQVSGLLSPVEPQQRRHQRVFLPSTPVKSAGQNSARPADKDTSEASLSDNRFAALSLVESGDNDNARGRDGEVSRFQILPAVWREVTSLPLSAAVNPFTAGNVSQEIMRRRTLSFVKRKHRQPTNVEWYLIFNQPSRVDRPTKNGLETAIRFSNLLASPITVNVLTDVSIP